MVATGSSTVFWCKVFVHLTLKALDCLSDFVSKFEQLFPVVLKRDGIGQAKITTNPRFENANRLIFFHELISNVRYNNDLTWLQGFRDKFLCLLLFSLYPSLFWKFRHKLNTFAILT